MITQQDRQRLLQNRARTGHAARCCRWSSQLGLDRQTSCGSGKGRRQYLGRTGQQHWFRITGLRGWKRAQLDMPAFGDAKCVPLRRTGLLRKVFDFFRRCFGQRNGKPKSPSDKPVCTIYRED